MARALYSNKAVEDLTSIWQYTFQTWSERQADIYYNNLVKACASTTSNPITSKYYDEISPGLLGLKAGHHIIFYKILPDSNSLIIRILHERMDIKRHI